MQYTDEQHAVAQNRSPRLLVRALAGTGKTETVALRIQSLIDEGTEPEVIQTLCFTRSAKKQLSERLQSKGLGAVRVRTVHSLAYETVSKWNEANGQEMRRVTNGEDIAAKALFKVGLTPSKSNVATIKNWNTAVWNGFIDGAQFGSLIPDEINAALNAYAKLKSTYGVLDFDDLAVAAGSMTSPDFDEVLVDEAQDLTTIQADFVENCSRNRLTYVGDSNQSIFAFAGSDGTMFDRLHDWDQRTLSKSFRSKERILAVANQVADDKLRTDLHGGVVNVEHVEYHAVTKRIVAATHTDKNTAILGRSRIGLERIADALTDAGRAVQRSWEDDVDDAEITVSSVHKAKGGEWDKVIVTDLIGTGFVGCDESDEEKRLFYVAATRAKQELSLMTLDGELPWGVTV